MKLKKTITIAALLPFGIVGFAQENSVAAGGDATGSGGSISYSVGQVVYTVNSDNNTVITQGIQQTYEVSDISAIGETAINLNVSVYPNPTTNFISMELENNELDGLSYQLIDFQGKIISNTKVAETKTNISMLELPQATYFIHVVKNNQTVKTFKIIKT
jgi:hypothetical protein